MNFGKWWNDDNSKIINNDIWKNDVTFYDIKWIYEMMTFYDMTIYQKTQREIWILKLMACEWKTRWKKRMKGA